MYTQIQNITIHVGSTECQRSFKEDTTDNARLVMRIQNLVFATILAVRTLFLLQSLMSHHLKYYSSEDYWDWYMIRQISQSQASLPGWEIWVSCLTCIQLLRGETCYHARAALRQWEVAFETRMHLTTVTCIIHSTERWRFLSRRIGERIVLKA